MQFGFLTKNSLTWLVTWYLHTFIEFRVLIAPVRTIIDAHLNSIQNLLGIHLILIINKIIHSIALIRIYPLSSSSLFTHYPISSIILIRLLSPKSFDFHKPSGTHHLKEIWKYLYSLKWRIERIPTSFEYFHISTRLSLICWWLSII